MKSIKIDFSDTELNTNANSECGGIVYSWICPDCGERISWAPDMWWEMKCCQDWTFEIKITGEKYDD
jgi:hypothetical protein